MLTYHKLKIRTASILEALKNLATLHSEYVKKKDMMEISKGIISKKFDLNLAEDVKLDDILPRLYLIEVLSTFEERDLTYFLYNYINFAPKREYLERMLVKKITKFYRK